MKRSYYSSSKILGVALLAGLWTMACSSDEGSNSATGGSTSATGGKSSTGTVKTGGASSTGTAKTGGATSTGGATATGGATSTGTQPVTGGATSTTPATSGVGGVTGGGTTGTGGTHAGGTGTGGVATGGSTSIIDAGDASTFTCAGCMKLYVPLETAGTGTDFEVDYGTSTTIDLSAVTNIVTAHVWVETGGNAGGLRLYAKNDDVTNYATAYSEWMNLADLDGKWSDIKIDFSTIAAGPTPPVRGTFDKSIVRWIGFNIAAGDAFDGSVLEPVTVYVDSIKFTPVDSPRVTDDILFTTSVEGFSINTFNSPVADSTVTWFTG